jgi:hypothetical protein
MIIVSIPTCALLPIEPSMGGIGHKKKVLSATAHFLKVTITDYGDGSEEALSPKLYLEWW